MSREMDLIKYNTIKRYVKDVLKMNISKTATDDLRIRFNDILKNILREGQQSARDRRRKTIMPRDTKEITEKHLGKRHLSWNDIFQEVKRLNAIELRNLSKAVVKYVKEEKKKTE